MTSAKYFKIPTAKSQLITTSFILLFSIIALYLFNFDSGYAPETKRFLNRAGGYIIMASALLGGFGFIWSKKHKLNLAIAQEEVIRINAELATANPKDINGLNLELTKANNILDFDFDSTVTTVGLSAFFLLGIGSTLQSLGA